MSDIRLSNHDQQLLDGAFGEAAALAMRMLVQLAEMHGAQGFIDIGSAHVASAYDNTPVNLDFARRLAELGARMAVPTTLTTCAFDTRTENPTAGSRQFELIELHKSMGCQPALTCAPYLGHQDIQAGDRLAWCESSAIVYANSVVGARCNRFPEFLDLCAALTGRVPEYGLYLDENRRAQVLVTLEGIPTDWLDDPWLFESLGILIGQRCGETIPAIEGLPAETSPQNLRALGAATAASGAIDMFHAIGVTPEARDKVAAFGPVAPKSEFTIWADDIRQAADSLNHHTGKALSAVCLGAPHAFTEDARLLLDALGGRAIHPNVRCYLAASPAVIAQWQVGGEMDALKEAGVRVVSGRCTYYAPALPGCDGHVATTSAKWAWYARNKLECDVSFMRLADAVDAACLGVLS